jgi:pyruvate/2-oxoglutarate/acetoin dehydrogenase E1 component
MADEYGLDQDRLVWIRRPGSDVTIVATGWMTHHALAAADRLAGEGVSAEVIDPRTLAPLDTATVIESVSKTGHLVLEEHVLPDEDKIVEAVRRVLSTTLVT